MYNAHKKLMKESIHSKQITKSNDNVLLVVYYYVRLFTILVSILFCNRDITQSRCIGKPVPGVHIFWKVLCNIRLRYYVEYLTFGTFIRTCNGTQIWMCKHVDTMLSIYYMVFSFIRMLCCEIIWGSYVRKN